MDAFEPVPPPPVWGGGSGRGRWAGALAPLVGLAVLAGLWSWRAVEGSAGVAVAVESGPVRALQAGKASATPPGSGGAGEPGVPRAGGPEPGLPPAGEGAGHGVAGSLAGVVPDGSGAGRLPGAEAGSSGAAAPPSGEPEASPSGAPGPSPDPPAAEGENLTGGAAGGGAGEVMGARPYPAGGGPGAASGWGVAPSGPMLAVHVAGAVAHPGVYLLPPGARVVDAVTAAGGPTREAALHALNLAAPLADGTRIQVPTQKELTSGAFVPGRDGLAASPPPGPGGTPANGPAGGAPGAASRPIDINRATAAELEALPGIGPALAQRIVADREVNGPFRRPQDLTRVAGIGAKTLEKLLPYITVGP